MSLVIVDTGCANLASVGFAFERLGVKAVISDDTTVISGADHVVLPGVGAAPFAMQKMREKGLIQTVQNLSQPVLGICLGMQIIFDRLDEGSPPTEGLGLIPGRVSSLDTQGLPSPHMGWNSLDIVVDDPIVHGVKTGDYAYFVHSYAVPPSKYSIACCKYGTAFTAIVRKGNIYGCQFHPERSSALGSTILRNFLRVVV